MKKKGLKPHYWLVLKELREEYKRSDQSKIFDEFVNIGYSRDFFDKGQKAIVSTLEKQKQVQLEDEKFDILLKGLDDDEKKVNLVMCPKCGTIKGNII